VTENITSQFSLIEHPPHPPKLTDSSCYCWTAQHSLAFHYFASSFPSVKSDLHQHNKHGWHFRETESRSKKGRCYKNNISVELPCQRHYVLHAISYQEQSHSFYCVSTSFVKIGNNKTTNFEGVLNIQKYNSYTGMLKMMIRN
jgi:hypothetical protein